MATRKIITTKVKEPVNKSPVVVGVVATHILQIIYNEKVRMALIGNIEQFAFGDDFGEYLERMEQLFLINVVTEEHKVALF